MAMRECLGPVFAARDYAGFVRRTAALIIDALFLSAVYAIAAWSWYWFAPAAWVTPRPYNIIRAAWVVGVWVYMLGMRLFPRGTLGYRCVGIRYAYMLPGEPSWTTLAFRSVMAVFLLWFFALDHFWILVDPRKQAWHDKVAGFYVVKRNAQPHGTQRVVRRVINFMLLTFVVWEPATEE